MGEISKKIKYNYPEEYCFPIMGYSLVKGKVNSQNLYGTCSYIKNNIFITAAHSILNSKESEYAGIAFRDNLEGKSGYTYHMFEETEIFEELDIGLVKLKMGHKNAIANKWSLEQTFMLEDVKAIGYPFGFNKSEGKITPRGIKGHIVTHRSFHEFTKKKPHIFELSFHCPKGISGSSLTTLKDDKIIGFVIGNASTEILVFEERELNESENINSIFQKYETTKYGIAITIHNLLNLESKILGMSFKSYLSQEKLI